MQYSVLETGQATEHQGEGVEANVVQCCIFFNRTILELKIFPTSEL